MHFGVLQAKHPLMLTPATYIEYLLSTPTNYTCTHLVAHLPDVSYDQVNRFLRTGTLPVN